MRERKQMRVRLRTDELSGLLKGNHVVRKKLPDDAKIVGVCLDVNDGDVVLFVESDKYKPLGPTESTPGVNLSIACTQLIHREQMLAKGFTAEEIEAFRGLCLALDAVFALPDLHGEQAADLSRVARQLEMLILVRPGLRAIGYPEVDPRTQRKGSES